MRTFGMWRLACVFLIQVVALLGATTTAAYAAGSLDSTFGANGVATISEPDLTSRAADLGFQPSVGRIILAGAEQPSWPNPATPIMVGIDDRGELDPSFGDDGRVRFVPAGFASFTIASFAVDHDESIVVVGYGFMSGSGDYRSAILRLAPDGTPDASFAGDGVYLTPTGDTLIKVEVLADGRIVAMPPATLNEWPIVALNHDGSGADGTVNGRMSVSLGGGAVGHTHAANDRPRR